ncbi:MAG: hypothetical protein CM15mP83_7150 [Flavobacteriaceae bacterium]|nr:MAG: hypothetical protein CM15mP83_7150 [Flavobacteriaceae bacterium]
MPDAWVLPVSINHSWKLMKWGNFPMMPGVCVRFTVHEPIPVQSEKASDLVCSCGANHRGNMRTKTWVFFCVKMPGYLAQNCQSQNKRQRLLIQQHNHRFGVKPSTNSC